MLNDLIEGLLGCQTLDGIEHERPVDGLIADRERPHSRGERLERLFGRELHQQPLFVRAGLRVLDRFDLEGAIGHLLQQIHVVLDQRVRHHPAGAEDEPLQTVARLLTLRAAKATWHPSRLSAATDIRCAQTVLSAPTE